MNLNKTTAATSSAPPSHSSRETSEVKNSQQKRDAFSRQEDVYVGRGREASTSRPLAYGQKTYRGRTMDVIRGPQAGKKIVVEDTIKQVLGIDDVWTSPKSTQN